MKKYQVGEVAQEQEVMRSIKPITQSIRLTYYERFHDQSVDEGGDLIEEAMMTKLEPIDLNQTLKNESWK